MAFTEEQMELLNNNQISLELFAQIPQLNNTYYLSPYMYIRDTLGLKLTCTGQEYRLAVECANDEDVMPEGAGLPVIVDGVLAYVFGEQLEACGLDLVTYFTYRFFPPSPEFQKKLDKFERLIREAVV